MRTSAELSETTARTQRSEFGLFVLWPNGREHDELVLDYLRSRFQVLDVADVIWTPELAASNYSRFYRTRLVPPLRSSLVYENGVGGALVIGVMDQHPSHTRRDTRRSGSTVSLNVLDARDALVARLGGLVPMHAAETEGQAAREYMLLLERNAADVMAAGPWPGTVPTLERDLAGTGGWRDVRQMFAVMNAGSPYVVLRNYEGLADLSFLPGHTDIDILTADYAGTVALLGAVSRLGVIPRHGGRFDVRIGSRSVICDLRLTGDDYFDPAWAQEILRTRRLHSDGFFVPAEDEYLDSLLYHAVVHKPAVRSDYQIRLAEMAREQGRVAWDSTVLSSPETARQVLTEVLAARGFSIRRPKDPTVFYNHRVTRIPFPRVARLGAAFRRRVYRHFMRFIRYPVRFAVLSVSERLWRTSRRMPHLGQPPGRGDPHPRTRHEEVDRHRS